MITLKKIKLENFLSHENTEISFQDETKLLIEGKSGAGKSSLVEAILWCFYGKGRVDNRNIIKKGAKNASVSLWLDDDGTIYQITRKTSQKGSQALDLTVIGADNIEELVKIEGLREKQDWIEKKLLKSSYILFINSILYLQDNVDTFVKQTAVKRKELLLEIANVENYDLYYNRAKEELRLAEEDKTRIETLTEEKNRIIESNKEKAALLPDLEKQEIDLENKLHSTQEKIDTVRNDVEKRRELEVRFQNEKTNISFINNTIEGIVKDIQLKQNELSLIKDLNKDNIDRGLLELASKKEQLVSLEKEQADIIAYNDRIRYHIASKPREEDYDGKIADINKQLIDILKKNDTFCPSIGKECPKLVEKLKVHTDFFTNQLNEYNEKKLKQHQALKEYTEKLLELGVMKDVPNTFSLREEIKSLEHFEQDNIRYGYKEEKILAIKNLVERMNKENENKVAIEERCKKLEELFLPFMGIDYDCIFNKLKGDIVVFQAQKFQLAQEIALSKNAVKAIEESFIELTSLKERSNDVENKIESLSLVKEAFGSKGIKTMIIDHIVPILEDKINEILGQLSEFRIRLDTQRQSADGNIMLEGLFINIYNELGDEMDFDSYSGGERLKIVISLSEALASLQKCSFRCFDESFTSFDSESTEKFVEVLYKLKNNFKQVLCISHIREIKDIFDESIEVIKENGRSFVV